MLNIVIFGAPGSGKGTQSARIVEKYGLNHISTGDVLRAEIKNGTELGKTAKGYIDNGQLIPDALMIDILASVFDSFKDSKGVIFDGFPRTIAQAEALKKMLQERINTLQQQLAYYEQIKRITLLPHHFSMESGELTNTLKIRRPIINKNYQAEIDKMYEE